MFYETPLARDNISVTGIIALFWNYIQEMKTYNIKGRNIS
jgi:hypothetical protein